MLLGTSHEDRVIPQGLASDVHLDGKNVILASKHWRSEAVLGCVAQDICE
jgi:hypothetical protein